MTVTLWFEFEHMAKVIQIEFNSWYDVFFILALIAAWFLKKIIRRKSKFKMELEGKVKISKGGKEDDEDDLNKE